MLSTYIRLCRAAAFTILGIVPLACGQFSRAAETVTFEIIADDMCCSGCAKKVAAQLYTAPGVTDVKANVATRSVVVTAKPSRNLTLEKLWSAVEKGKGKPSRLVASEIAYTLTRAADLGQDEQPVKGVYILAFAKLQPGDSAERVAKILYGVRGVSRVSIDAPHNSLVVAPVDGATLSPWALAGAAQQAQEQPVSVAGPFGRLKIEHIASKNHISSRPGVEGEIR